MEETWRARAEPLLESAKNRVSRLFEDPSWDEIRSLENLTLFRHPGSLAFDIYKSSIEIYKNPLTVFEYLNNPNNISRWGKRLKKLEVKQEASGARLMYLQLRSEGTMEDRELLMVEKGFQEMGNYYIVGSSIEEDVPVAAYHIRGNMLLHGFKVTSLGHNRCRVEYLIELDTCGAAPKDSKEKIEQVIATNLKNLFSVM